MAFLLLLSAFSPAPQGEPTGYDLVVAVNDYRASKGYYALNPNALVASAAQAHAEWIVATGQGGHIGLNGSDETQRVSWTGYGGGASIKCDENWASGPSVNDALYGAWSDWTHQEVMLNAWGNRYTDIGGGVAPQGNGRYVFVLNVCMVLGKGSSGTVPGATANPLATPDLSNYVYGVTKATPQADGSIRHKVQYGQTLLGIADAYGITIDTLRTLNNIPANSTIIWPEQELLIQPASAATATVSIQPTMAPTNQIDESTPLPQPSPAFTITPILPTPQPAPDESRMAQLVGFLLVGIAGIGVALVLGAVLARKA